jgi:UDPglucose--hexose-1-phosphate uridylyltransferase
MSILRKDPLSHGWVIFAEERFEKPLEFDRAHIDLGRESCPFCPGNEAMTPPEICAKRPDTTKPDSPGWNVRTVPNQFAVLRIEGKLDRRGEGLYDMMNGIGAHEVVIETPDHDTGFPGFAPEKIEEVLSMFRERVLDLQRDRRFRYIQVFRNFGEPAGANIAHPHSHVIALPIVPRLVREEIVHAFDYWGMKERCIFCDIVGQDRRGRRLVYENNEFVALEPFASRFPFETWIYPLQHSSEFHRISDEGLAQLADTLKVTLGALEQALSNPAYNLVLHSAPCQPEKQYHTRRAQVNDYYHWHIEIIPRVTKVAGFEYGTGFYINPVLPENAAQRLRDVVEAITGRKAIDG